MKSFFSKTSSVIFGAVLGFTAPLMAADSAPDTYAATAAQRALKISASLALTDPGHLARVRTLIAQQYLDLQALQAWRDQGLASAKQQPDKVKIASSVAELTTSYAGKLASLHRSYLARLAVELTPEQIDRVKDGHTYGVLPLTFRTYQQMLPQLTSTQKAKILALLTEAREQAMDAGTAKEKHAWFGKYKGKINNYLSAEGYNMKQAEKNFVIPR